MNPRVLELLKDPKNIQSEDLILLKDEINSFPYIQNIRALHLYGIHLYDKENYQKELSITAAYTTDKKILYQLINGKIQQKSTPKIAEEKKPEMVKERFEYIYKSSVFPIKRDDKQEAILNKKKEETFLIQPPPKPEIKHVYVEGEKNRILFEGEENFLEHDNMEKIDLESTLESGSIVTHKIENQAQPAKEVDTLENLQPELVLKQNKDEHQREEVAKFTPEEMINEEEIISENEIEKINNEAELSFHATDSFLPDVKILSNNKVDETVHKQNPQPSINKHEEEMRRLIEEVEKKMKTAKVSFENKTPEPEVPSHEISFAETQSFHIEPTKEQVEEKTGKENSNLIENKAETDEEPTLSLSTWKPMNFVSNIPDSFINTSIKTPLSNEETPKQKEIVSEIKEKIQEPEKKVRKEETTAENSGINTMDSNVPGFINTWQNWLKIDRQPKEVEKVKAETKNKVIESFIENNPRISQLKDEVNFVVKEKTNDISHLMTETLANLYFEQKLYSKAINAFNVLINKHPEKKDYFQEKIQKIKEIRGK